MNPRLLVLDHLSYITECLAQEFLGEAKTELANLAKKLKTDNSFQFNGSQNLAESLDEAYLFLRHRKDRDAIAIVCSSSRNLWKDVASQGHFKLKVYKGCID